jgi:hypothetical protein
MPDQDPVDETVTDATRRTEADDATVPSGADRAPTAEEEAAAERSAEQVDPSVAEHYREMSEIGAEVQGEGEIS